MVQKHDYYHIEPVNTHNTNQYLIRFPHDPHDLEWPKRLSEIAKRFMKGPVREVRVFTLYRISDSTSRLGLNGNLWRGPKGEVFWGPEDHSFYSRYDPKTKRFITVKEFVPRNRRL